MPNDINTLITTVRSITNIADTTILPDAAILEFANETIERMVQGGSEFAALDQSVDLTYTGANDGVPTPPTLRKIYGVWTFDSAQSDPSLALVEVKPTTRREWIDRATRPDESRTYPVPSLTGLWYYLFEQKLFLVPQPTADVKVRVDFSGPIGDLVLAATGQPGTSNYFTQFYYRTLKWGTLALAWDHLAEPDRAEYAESKFADLYDKVKKVETAYRTSGAPRVRGV